MPLMPGILASIQIPNVLVTKYRIKNTSLPFILKPSSFTISLTMCAMNVINIPVINAARNELSQELPKTISNGKRRLTKNIITELKSQCTMKEIYFLI